MPVGDPTAGEVWWRMDADEDSFRRVAVSIVRVVVGVTGGLRVWGIWLAAPVGVAKSQKTGVWERELFLSLFILEADHKVEELAAAEKVEKPP